MATSLAFVVPLCVMGEAGRCRKVPTGHPAHLGTFASSALSEEVAQKRQNHHCRWGGRGMSQVLLPDLRV